MKTSLCATAVAVLLGISLLAAARARGAEVTDCDRSESKVSTSPDGRWTASVQEEVCAVGRQTGAAITVQVAPVDAPQEMQRAAATAVPRSRDEWPVALWRGPAELEVWVPNLAHVLEVQPAVGSVKVALKYCNDDPADRQRVQDYKVAFEQWKRDTTAWVARRKADPAGAGPRPERPAEPRLSVGRCDPEELAGKQ